MAVTEGYEAGQSGARIVHERISKNHEVLARALQDGLSAATKVWQFRRALGDEIPAVMQNLPEFQTAPAPRPIDAQDEEQAANVRSLIIEGRGMMDRTAAQIAGVLSAETAQDQPETFMIGDHLYGTTTHTSLVSGVAVSRFYRIDDPRSVPMTVDGEQVEKQLYPAFNKMTGLPFDQAYVRGHEGDNLTLLLDLQNELELLDQAETEPTLF